MSRRLAASLLAVAAAFAAGAAHADDAAPGAVVTLGGGAEFGPRFPGARRTGVSPAPSFDIRGAGEPERFSAPQDNLDFAFVETGRVSFGPVAALRWGRTKRDTPRAMHGVATTPTVPEIGGFADLWIVPDTLRTRVDARHGVRANDGLVADLSADVVRSAGRVTLSGGPRLSAASGAVMNRTFGVDASEALANGAVGAFRPSGGVQSLGLGASLRIAATPDTFLKVYGQYDRLVGEAAKSPVVRSFGSPNQTTFGLGVDHAFSFAQ